MLKVGIIGVGGITRLHFPGGQASPQAQIVALADISAAVLQRVGDELGVRQRYENRASTCFAKRRWRPRPMTCAA